MKKILEFIYKHYEYAKYVLYHKWRVMVWAYRLCKPVSIEDIPFLWQCFVHDSSKFYPSEWFPYANYFCGGKKEEDKQSFKLAWALHLTRNPHHWNHWIKCSNGTTPHAEEMPRHYVFEMIADWQSAGESQSNPTNIRDWYIQNLSSMTLHPKTKEMIEVAIGKIMQYKY